MLLLAQTQFSRKILCTFKIFACVCFSFCYPDLIEMIESEDFSPLNFDFIYYFQINKFIEYFDLLIAFFSFKIALVLS